MLSKKMQADLHARIERRAAVIQPAPTWAEVLAQLDAEMAARTESDEELDEFEEPEEPPFFEEPPSRGGSPPLPPPPAGHAIAV